MQCYGNFEHLIQMLPTTADITVKQLEGGLFSAYENLYVISIYYLLTLEMSIYP